MTDETGIAVVPESVPTPSFHAVAVNATEMREANSQIRKFLGEKVAAISQEYTELRAAADIAIKNKWASKALVGQANRAMQKKVYYDKLLAAIDAGFTVVPNMPCDQFAIRVKRISPNQPMIEGQKTTGNWVSTPELPDEKEQHLPQGEGRYESPSQRVHTELKSVFNEKGEVVKSKLAWPVDFADIEFPLMAAVPVVMTATQAAMALKLFDRIGLVPQSIRRGDPIVLGQIVRKVGWSEKVTSFLIAWHLDMRTL